MVFLHGKVDMARGCPRDPADLAADTLERLFDRGPHLLRNLDDAEFGNVARKPGRGAGCFHDILMIQDMHPQTSGTGSRGA